MGRTHRFFVVAAVAVAAMVPVSVSAGSGSSLFHPPSRHYLALGDSLAFGFHQQQFLTEIATNTYSAASFNDGYVDDFAAMLTGIDPGIETANLGCPGETTSSMLGIGGNCSFPLALHYAPAPYYQYAASQMDAALSYLAAYGGTTVPITLDIGGNDVLHLVGDCGGDSTCMLNGLPATITTMVANLGTIIGELQSASSRTELLVMNVPDPYEFALPATIPIFAAFNLALDAVVTSRHAVLVDAFDKALAYYVHGDYSGFCALSGVCTPPLYDLHPSAAGYEALAQYFWDASGYARLH